MLVETGTYVGEMVDAMKDSFEKIYSIELGVELARNAQEKFSAYSHIHIIQGDSGQVLKTLASQIRQPALFWLDGHYSAGITAKGAKDTPVCEELQYILEADNQDGALLEKIEDSEVAH